jgi:hypothetical protein
VHQYQLWAPVARRIGPWVAGHGFVCFSMNDESVYLAGDINALTSPRKETNDRSTTLDVTDSAGGLWSG